jgi:hypothetical protein
MLARKLILSAAACFVAAAVFAEEPECAANYKSDGSSAETSVLTSLAPSAVIERLPRKLNAAGATMEWAEPQKGTLKAGPLSVNAEASGSVTRVTFRTSPAADKATLCRYATLVGNSPIPPEPELPQDPALIAQMKDELLKKHQIVQPDVGHGLNNATFRSLDDFLELKIKRVTDLAADKRQYDVAMLLPRKACGVVTEDIDDATDALGGHNPRLRTQPVRVQATLIYTNKDGAWHLGDATITHLESVK